MPKLAILALALSTALPSAQSGPENLERDLTNLFKKDLHRSVLQEFDPRQRSTITGKGIWIEQDNHLFVGDQHGPTLTIANITLRRISEFCTSINGTFSHPVNRGEPTNTKVRELFEIDGIHECRSHSNQVLFDVTANATNHYGTRIFATFSPHVGEDIESRRYWKERFDKAQSYIERQPIFIPQMRIGAEGMLENEEVLVINIRGAIAEVQLTDGKTKWVRIEEIRLVR